MFIYKHKIIHYKYSNKNNSVLLKGEKKNLYKIIFFNIEDILQLIYSFNIGSVLAGFIDLSIISILNMVQIENVKSDTYK